MIAMIRNKDHHEHVYFSKLSYLPSASRRLTSLGVRVDVCLDELVCVDMCGDVVIVC